MAPPRWARARTALRAARPALLAYAAVRLTGLVIFLVAAHFAGEDAFRLLGERWDSLWYQWIAESGYGYEIHLRSGAVHADLAFFPMLPMLERGLSGILPMSPATAGLAVSWTASLAAAAGIRAVGSHLYDARTGVVLAVLWGVHPAAYVQSMAYTETLFTAAAAWALYAVLTGRWITAGALVTVAGLTRPSAVALIAAVVLAALAALARDLGAGAGPAVALRTRWRMCAGAAVAPLGWLAYLAYVGVREGHPLAYFHVQGEWGNSIDGGRALARFAGRELTGPHPLAGAVLIAAFALLGWAVLLSVKQRQPLPVLVYSLGIVTVSLIGAAYFESRPRLLMPAFPLLLPAAVAVARLRPARAWWTLGALAAASGLYGASALLGSGPP